LSFKLFFDFSFLSGQFSLLNVSDSGSADEGSNFFNSDGHDSGNFFGSTDGGLGFQDFLLGDRGLLFIFGDHHGIVLEYLSSFFSLGKSLLMRLDENILQVSYLNLVFSLVLKSCGGIVN
jgi:hypothetical protein